MTGEAITINQPIVAQKVVSKNDQPDPQEQQASNEPELEVLHEKMERPEELRGRTYKVKPPVSEHAIYITINDVVLNEDTQYEEIRPYELFLQSKEMQHFQWMVAMTRLISAMFRTGGDVSFLIDELKNVHDPNGGYFKKGGVFMPSIVAEVGHVIERHLQDIGMIEKPGLTKEQQELIDEKREKMNANNQQTSDSDASASEDNGFPPDAQVCAKCHTKAVVMMDGCLTCLSCADSKCG